MKTTLRNAGLMATALLALTATGAAIAADAAKPAPRTAPAPGDHGPRGMRHDPEARADHLRAVLQLRADQEPALKTFLDASQPPARDGKFGGPGGPPDADGAGPDHKALTTPQRLDWEAGRIAEHQAMFAKRAAATKAFYAALSPAQQKAFDALPMGGPGGRHGGHHGGRGHQGGPGGERHMRGGPDMPPPPGER